MRRFPVKNRRFRFQLLTLVGWCICFCCNLTAQTLHIPVMPSVSTARTPGSGTGIATVNNSIFSGGTADGFAVACNSPAGVPLPVQLLSFSGRCEMTHVVLEWTTASETNNAFFTIERLNDAFNWEVICRINGGGNSSSALHYSCTDELSHVNTTYYRLTQTDFNGVTAFHTPIEVSACIGETAPLNIFPNPTRGMVTITCGCDLSGVILYNALGQSVYILESTSSFQQKLDLSFLPAGVYLLEVGRGNQIRRKKLVLD